MMMQETMLHRSAERIVAIAEEVDRMERRLDSLRAALVSLLGEDEVPDSATLRLC